MTSLYRLFLSTCVVMFLASSIHAQTIPTFYGAKKFPSSNNVLSDVALRVATDINNDGDMDIVGIRSCYVNVLYLDGAEAFIGDTFYLISLNGVKDCDTADLNH